MHLVTPDFDNVQRFSADDGLRLIRPTRCGVWDEFRPDKTGNNRDFKRTFTTTSR